jgi:deoxyribonuclease-4
MLLLGAHVSIAGGVEKSLAVAGQLKINCMQIFVKNQRQWRAAPLRKDQVTEWFNVRQHAKPKIEHIVAHSAYLINLASDYVETRRRSIDALKGELRRCGQLGIDRLVIHPGSHRGQGLLAGIALIVKGLDEVLSESENAVKILLETTAGSGNAIGSRFEEIATIMDRCRYPDRLGCCLDTCHLFAAGYTLSPRNRFEAMIRKIDRLIGCERIGCIHLNDSLGPLGSHCDRHAHIGRGRIGPETFGYFVRSRKFAGVPKIIETPKGPGGQLDYDFQNLKRLRALYCLQKGRRAV